MTKEITMATPSILLDDPILVSSENDEDGESTTSESLNFDESISSVGSIDDDEFIIAAVENTLEQDSEPTSMDETYAMLAKEMNKLSMKCREEVLHDIHGVSDIPDEDPAFIADRLARLDVSINRMVSTRGSRSGYEQARDANPDYVNDEKFRLMFLRSVRFNPDHAARKMYDFFECKRELFGADKLVRDIVIDDLNADDRRSLESGFFQLLPARDPAGRAILCGSPMLKSAKVPENYMRTFYYMVMTALTDEETQKKGMVLVGHNMGHKSATDRTPVRAIMRMRQVLPMRVVTLHYCHDNAKARPIMYLAAFLSGAYGRVRFRPQYGSPSEVRFKLSTFGIPIDTLPITEEGECKLKPHKQWVQRRRKEEKAAAADGMQRVVVPSRFDVLFGRGKPIQEHPGNLRYHQILESCRDRYDAAKKFEKMEISDFVVQIVKGYSGRFLKQDHAGWIVATVDEAREKVSHAFRTRRSATKASTSSSGTTIRRRVEETPEAALSAPIMDFNAVEVGGGKRIRV